jgi:acyl-CoA thioester hydrolase
MSESAPFKIRIRVRFRDVDVIGHVNNAVYFTYMEQARTEYWMQLFQLRELGELAFIVAHAECDYKIPARFKDELEVSIWTTGVRNTSFVWEYEIRNVANNEVMALGKTIQVYYDYSQRKAIPVPPETRKKLLS